MSEPQPDPAQTDRAWSGYHPRAAVPVLVPALALALFVSTGRHYLDDFSALAARVSALALFALPWVALAGACAAYLYKCITFTYRLTDRAVFADFGPLFRPVPPLELPAVRAVRVRAGPLARLLGVGRVEVRSAGRVLRLPGVRNPHALAELIRAAVPLHS
jgi:membrane protein YdbS with pleckstrin-like domain